MNDWELVPMADEEARENVRERYPFHNDRDAWQRVRAIREAVESAGRKRKAAFYILRLTGNRMIFREVFLLARLELREARAYE